VIDFNRSPLNSSRRRRDGVVWGQDSIRRSRSARWRRTSCCLGSIACSQTSSAGAWAFTTACEGQTFSTTSMSSCSASIGRRTRHAAFDTLLGIGARIAPVPYQVLIRKAA